MYFQYLSTNEFFVEHHAAVCAARQTQRALSLAIGRGDIKFTTGMFPYSRVANHARITFDPDYFKLECAHGEAARAADVFHHSGACMKKS